MAGDRFYDQTAEYVAVLLPGAWRGLGAALTSALDGIDPAAGPIVDVGAGSGFGTAVLARAFPGADIVAVEPNQALRTALLTRVVEDEDMASRVTILAADLFGAELPETFAGVALMNVIGHFSPADRRKLWALLAERLAPSGRAVLNLYPPTRPETVPSTPMSEVTVGRRRYLGSAAAEPAGSDAVTWRMTYRVEQDGRAIQEFTADDHWYVFTPEALAAEVAEHNLRVTAGDPDYGIQIIAPA